MKKLIVCLVLLAVAGRSPAQSQSTLDGSGVTLLYGATTNLNGAGVRVAQVEADYGASAFEINPQIMNQPAGLFRYISTNAISTNFPNTIGLASGHADAVGQVFYGMVSSGVFQGVATNVAHIDNYEGGGFVQVGGLAIYTVTLPSTNINDSVVNQSFAYAGNGTSLQTTMDTSYDNYAAKYNTLFVSSAGNSGSVSPPSTCYNGLSVGAYGGASSYGPTPDNSRAKPDLVAPVASFEAETSYSAPLVAGAAAVLVQAGLRGDGGADTNSAVAMATLKALLINGAIKPLGWTNVSPSPLSTNYGAGVMNLYESYKQLTGGKHGYNATSAVATGSAHPPVTSTASVGVLSGWDYNTNTSSSSDDEVNHYFFNVTNGASSTTFTTTATLAWNRHQSQTAINNLKLYLYNTANNNLVASSVSTVDNVQHVWVPRLPAGRYDLQVWKAGGFSTVSTAESYALAYEFVTSSLAVSGTSTNVTLSWPVYPAGFRLASTTNLLTAASSWNTNYPAPTVANSQNQIVLGTSNSAGFFQLTRP